MSGEKPYYPEKDYTGKCYNCIYGGKTYDLRGEERHICGKRHHGFCKFWHIYSSVQSCRQPPG